MRRNSFIACNCLDPSTGMALHKIQFIVHKITDELIGIPLYH